MMSRNLLVVLALVTAAFAAGCSPDSGDTLPPIDVSGDRADADGIGPPPPDYDGDTISDEDEGRPSNVDTDGDGTPDWQDDDSDGDTIPDSLEAGDTDPRTAPGDADADGT
ncbi:MAG: hypothetical protein GYA57_04955, partial [Myxococcales bacterium]|nr:hypothetical protein [Myxococcales bacterium]